MNRAPLALVTGANKNIGLAIARGLARSGATVLLGSRSLDAGQKAAEALAAEGLLVEPIALDVTSAPSIAAAVDAIEARSSALDILVNNAGIADRRDGAASVTETEVLRRTFETNFFGAAALTRALLPLLRRASAGRIVNVSSSLGSIGLAATPGSRYREMLLASEPSSTLLGYRASKVALNYLTVMLAAELAATRIKVNSASPGYVPTDLNAHLPVPAAAPRQTADEAATTPIRLALLGDDGPTGGFFDARGELPW